MLIPIAGKCGNNPAANFQNTSEKYYVNISVRYSLPALKADDDRPQLQSFCVLGPATLGGVSERLFTIYQKIDRNSQQRDIQVSLLAEPLLMSKAESFLCRLQMDEDQSERTLLAAFTKYDFFSSTQQEFLSACGGDKQEEIDQAKRLLTKLTLIVGTVYTPEI